MFDHVFPEAFDNAYRGQRLALWPVALMKLAQGVNSVVNPHLVMSKTAGWSSLPREPLR